MYPNGQMFGSNLMGTSPLGMDLGEFLLEGDLQFLNQIASAQQAQVINKMNGNVIETGNSDQVTSEAVFTMMPN
jgi:hypothetical protein